MNEAKPKTVSGCFSVLFRFYFWMCDGIKTVTTSSQQILNKYRNPTEDQIGFKAVSYNTVISN